MLIKDLYLKRRSSDEIEFINNNFGNYYFRNYLGLWFLLRIYLKEKPWWKVITGVFVVLGVFHIFSGLSFIQYMYYKLNKLISNKVEVLGCHQRQL
jgi:hypothetical protein